MKLRVLAVPGMRHTTNEGYSWVTQSFIAVDMDSGVIYIKRPENLAWLRLEIHSEGPNIPRAIVKYSKSIRAWRSNRDTSR